MDSDEYVYGDSVAYKGTPVSKYNSEPVTVSGYTYLYEGTGSTVYEASTEAPVNAGTYNLVVAVSNSDENYTGKTEIPFEIEKAGIDFDIPTQSVKVDASLNTRLLIDGITEGDESLLEGFVPEFEYYAKDRGNEPVSEWEVTSEAGSYAVAWSASSISDFESRLESVIDNYDYNTIVFGEIEVAKKAVSHRSSPSKSNLPKETAKTENKQKEKEAEPVVQPPEEKKEETKENLNEIILTIGDVNATVFGEAKVNDVAPIIRNERTLLPARFVAEALGAKVDWDAAERKVTVTRDDTEIVIIIDSDIAYVNGSEYVLDSVALIINDRTYTPVRFIAEALGAKVDWNANTQQVIITK